MSLNRNKRAKRDRASSGTATLAECKKQASNSATHFFEVPDQNDQSPPPFDGVFPRNNAWTTQTYHLPDFDRPGQEFTEAIEGVEELALFIMHGGCKIVWKDKSLCHFCHRSQDNFIYACRYVGWATLNADTQRCFSEVKDELRAAYVDWCAYGRRSSVNLIWESFANFTWQLHNWGSGGWVMPVLKKESAV